MTYKKKILPIILTILILLPYWPFALSVLGSCGDNTLDVGEQCEPPNTERCNSTCQVIPCDCTTLDPDEEEGFCGDGIVQSDSEQCDDANNIGFDTCTNICRTGPNLSDLASHIDYSDYTSSNSNLQARAINPNIRFDVLPPTMPAIIRPCGMSAPACNGTCGAGQTCATAGVNMCMCIADVNICANANLAANCVNGMNCPNAIDGRVKYCVPNVAMDACICEASVQEGGGNSLNNCMLNMNAVNVNVLGAIQLRSFSALDDTINDLKIAYGNMFNTDLDNYRATILMALPAGETPAIFVSMLAENLQEGNIVCAMPTWCANTRLALLASFVMSAPLVEAKFYSLEITGLDSKNLTGLDLHPVNSVDFSLRSPGNNSIDLHCSNLNMANLEKVYFIGLNSAGANLQGTSLVNAMLNNAYMRFANLSANEPDGYPGADISSANFASADLRNSIFTSVRFNSNPTTFMGALINDLRIDQTTFDRLPGAVMGGNTIMGASGMADVF